MVKTACTSYIINLLKHNLFFNCKERKMNMIKTLIFVCAIICIFSIFFGEMNMNPLCKLYFSPVSNCSCISFSLYTLFYLILISTIDLNSFFFTDRISCITEEDCLPRAVKSVCHENKCYHIFPPIPSILPFPLE
jgi:hypothetical protein